MQKVWCPVVFLKAHFRSETKDRTLVVSIGTRRWAPGYAQFKAECTSMQVEAGALL